MLLQLQHISYAYSGSIPVLNNISMELQVGKIYAVMGGNGAGKTTLFNCITGFRRPQQGRIYFKGYDITRSSPCRINQAGIGRIFQDLRLISRLSVRENILLASGNDPTVAWYKAALPCTFYRRQRGRQEEYTDALLEEYLLTEVAGSLAGNVSYGQQKLLTVACCVATGAELLMLDEPLAGISPAYREKIAGLMMSLRMKGKTILMIEHHTDFIRRLAQGVFFLAGGRLEYYDDYLSLQTDPKAINAYL
jgi:branched-chain amino acid transport system ATP-binding protein